MIEARPNRQILVAPGAIDHHVADMTATISADVSLNTVQEILATKNQWLPIDGDGEMPLGHLIETNSTGPLRLGYGTWRDLLLGVQFHNGQGDLITAGGRTVKNVAGYDLTKFMVGQRGIFGRLVTVTTRTYRRPAAALLSTFEPDPRIVSLLLPSDLKPQWTLLVPGSLLCGYVGDERTISYYLQSLPAYRPLMLAQRSLEEDIAHRARLWQPERSQLRTSVPPAKIQKFITDAGLRDWVADSGFGIVLGHRDRSEGAPDPALKDLLERLKRAFDPEDHLQPLPWRAS